MSQRSVHAQVRYLACFPDTAWVHVPPGCKQALTEVAYSVMKGEQGVTRSSWHTVDLYLHLPHSNSLVCLHPQ